MESILITATILATTQMVSGKVEKKEEIKVRPNILFAISDDQSFAHTSFSGSRFVNTPGFDRVAREGVYFT
ncbi:MAG: hypothetical protein RBS73_14575, partial [Prolixibacteraceae bacterium]|nr:hypothetical protein [Prolixibacteraceae bacterium]